MRRVLVLVILSAAVCACGDSSTSPSAAAGSDTLTFNNLTTNGAAVPLYHESGYSLSAIPAAWIAVTTYGHPAPFIEFVSTEPTVGEVHISADGHASFRFSSVDVYSSVTRIPYTITGVRDFQTVFTLSDTLPNTFGLFRTVANPDASTSIDTLTIALTNPVPLSLQNPVGIDNIVLTR